MELQDSVSHKRNEEHIEGESQSGKHCNCHCLHKFKKEAQNLGLSIPRINHTHEAIQYYSMCSLKDTKRDPSLWDLFSHCVSHRTKACSSTNRDLHVSFLVYCVQEVLVIWCCRMVRLTCRGWYGSSQPWFRIVREEWLNLDNKSLRRRWLLVTSSSGKWPQVLQHSWSHLQTN